MRVLVFGASGLTGRQIVVEALRRGHEVVGFARGDALTAEVAGHGIARGDATVSRDVEAAVAGGFDAVVSALGARSLKKTGLLEASITNVIAAMRRTHARRLIELSAAGTFGLPRTSRISLGERLTFEILRRTILRHSFDDHAAADRLIQQSGLDWTIVQPPELSDGPARGYGISVEGLGRRGAVTRADVAAAIIDIMETRSFIGESLFLFPYA